MPVLSIITAIHNGLAFNQLFYESLKKYTVNDFELIIIDNLSTDGSREYFRQQGAHVIANEVNYSYPYCQNQGIAVAEGEYLCFLNNDIILCPDWDRILIEASRTHGLDILSGAGVENLGTFKATRRISRKWKRTKNPLSAFGFGRRNLSLMLRLMYGNWERYCRRRYAQYGLQVVEGIVGNNVFMTRRGLDLAGLWDERLQVADFDLFMRSKKRQLEKGDLQPCHIALGCFIHHFGKMTLKYASVKPVPFADGANLTTLDYKWSPRELEELHPDNSTLRKR